MSFTWTLNISNFCFFLKVRKSNVGCTFRIKLKFNGFEFHVGLRARGAFHNLYAPETRNDHTRKRSGSKAVVVQIISYETPEKLHKISFQNVKFNSFCHHAIRRNFRYFIRLETLTFDGKIIIQLKRYRVGFVKLILEKLISWETLLLVRLHIFCTEFLTKENKEGFGKHFHKFNLKIRLKSETCWIFNCSYWFSIKLEIIVFVGEITKSSWKFLLLLWT